MFTFVQLLPPFPELLTGVVDFLQLTNKQDIITKAKTEDNKKYFFIVKGL